MRDDLTTIVRFLTPIEATICRTLLGLAGIPCHLDGELIAMWFWSWWNAIREVKVVVRTGDAAEALELLQPMLVRGARYALPDQPAEWQCPDCKNPVDAGFEVCWFCAGFEDQVESAVGDDKQIAGDVFGESVPMPSWLILIALLCPPFLVCEIVTRLVEIRDAVRHARDEPELEPTRSVTDGPSTRPNSIAIGSSWNPDEPTFEEGVRRAGYAAVFAISILPVLFNLYSLWILYRLGTNRISDDGTTRLLRIWVHGINAIVLGTFGIMLVAWMWNTFSVS